MVNGLMGCGKYTIPTETGLKDYYVRGTYDGDFNEEGTPKEVLTATGEGKDRFYVMALEDISTSTYTWYESKIIDGIEVTTSKDFGTGRANTATMLATWKADTDKTKSSSDVWGQIESQVNNGWFLPSHSEWAAFAEELKITSVNYGVYGLRDDYWSSSQDSVDLAWYAQFIRGCMYNHGIDYSYSVRLCTTF